VGHRDSGAPEQLLQAKVVMGTAADLRKEVTDTAEKARDKQNAIQQAIEDTDAYAQQAADDAATGLEDATAHLATKLDGLAASATPVAVAAAATGVAATPIVTPAPPPPPPATPATPVAAAKRADYPEWATTAQDRLAKAGKVQAAAAYDALDKTGFYGAVMRSPKPRAVNPTERKLLETIASGMVAANVGSLSTKFKGILQQVQADAAAATLPAPPSTPITAPATQSRKNLASPSVPSTPVAAPISYAKAATETAAKQTGSGLPRDWRAVPTQAMDMADSGNKVGALRLLADAAHDQGSIPAENSTRHTRSSCSDGQL